jgi:hypothetical protein
MITSTNWSQKASKIQILSVHEALSVNNSCLNRILKFYKTKDNPCVVNLKIKNKHPQ